MPGVCLAGSSNSPIGLAPLFQPGMHSLKSEGAGGGQPALTMRLQVRRGAALAGN